jgi:methylthioribulose-1-phosphate dehydratase
MKTSSRNKVRSFALPDGTIDPQTYVVEQMIAAGHALYTRNWALGAAGSLSAIISQQPFEGLITADGANKGKLTAGDFLHFGESGNTPDLSGLSSKEIPIHQTIMVARSAGVILHTQSIWSTVLSELYANAGGITLEGFQILKNLSGPKTKQRWEWVPILENLDHSTTLARMVSSSLQSHPEIHAVLIPKRGLYTWGTQIDEAMRHVEVFEFLFEVLARQLHIISQIGHDQLRTNQSYS